MSEATPRVALIAITKHGCELAHRVAGAINEITVVAPSKFTDKFSNLQKEKTKRRRPLVF